MKKQIGLSVVLLLLTGTAYAQWTPKDSLRLRRLLESGEELELNREAVKLIDFGGVLGSPKISTEKNWLKPDETLPDNLPKKRTKVPLVLHPWPLDCAYNYDPILRQKIYVNKYTWRGGPPLMGGFVMPKKPVRAPQKGAIGVRIESLDLMAIFEKRFWNKKERKRRARTLEVLSTYNDTIAPITKSSVEQLAH
jgi:hypothetical protein